MRYKKHRFNHQLAFHYILLVTVTECARSSEIQIQEIVLRIPIEQ